MINFKNQLKLLNKNIKIQIYKKLYKQDHGIQLLITQVLKKNKKIMIKFIIF